MAVRKGLCSHRVSQTAHGEGTHFLIDTVRPYFQVLQEYTPASVLKVSYVHGLDLISQSRAGVKSFYHVDGLGSTRALSNDLGLVTDRYIYDAFGRTIGQVGGTGNVYLFAGEQRDVNLRLDYLRARYLNSGAGRFVSRDRFEGVVRDPVTLHKYVYANNNSPNVIDPTGWFGIVETLSAIAIKDFLFLTTIRAGAGIAGDTVVFLGGGGDSTSGIVRDWAANFRANHTFGTGVDVRYFGWDGVAAAAILVAGLRPKADIVLVGHSWGGDAAYQVAVAARSLQDRIALLVTIDPVGRWTDTFDPNTIGRPPSVKRWINVPSTSTDDASDWVALFGGRWGSISNAGAENRPLDVDHERFYEMLNDSGALNAVKNVF